jgi:hypothetical protein
VSSGCHGGQLEDRILAQWSDGFQRHVTGALNGPFIVLLEQDGADQAGDSVLIGEDADDVSAALDLAIESFQRIGAVDLGSVILGEAHKGEDIGFGLIHQRRQLCNLGPELIGDLAPLQAGHFGVLLGKGGGDEGSDDTPALLAGMGQDIAHEVHAATLPGGMQHLGNRRLEPLMRIRDHQLDAAQAAPGQRTQKLGPEGLGLRGAINLAPVAVKSVSGSQFDTWIALVTVLIIGLIAVAAQGIWRRLPIIIGAIGGYLLYVLLANGLGLEKPIDFTALTAAPWIGLPKFTGPSFHADAMFLIAPVAIILVAENLGHIKAIGVMTGRSLDSFLGRAFLGDSLATIVSALGGGTGVTTYAENIGVMAATKVYSTLLFVVAAIVSILLGFSPKFGALILSIPGPVIGGFSIVLFGLIAAMAGRIWVENKVDFS